MFEVKQQAVDAMMQELENLPDRIPSDGWASATVSYDSNNEDNCAPEVVGSIDIANGWSLSG